MVVKKKMQKIQGAVNLYTNKNVYNMDESALFWKMTLNGTLETEQSARNKNDKVCITINLDCNVTWSNKLEF